MEIKIDLKADAMYIKFQEGKFHRNKVIDEDTIIDLDKDNKIIGIGILNMTERIPKGFLSDVSVKVPTQSLQK